MVEDENIITGYLFTAFSIKKRKLAVNRIVRFLNTSPLLPAHYHICFRGYSGALMAPIISYKVNKPMLLVLKEGETQSNHRHFEGNIEGYAKNVTDYVIIDDIISSGKTVKTIKQEVSSINSDSNLLGVVCYSCHYRDQAGFEESDNLGCWVKTFYSPRRIGL